MLERWLPVPAVFSLRSQNPRNHQRNTRLPAMYNRTNRSDFAMILSHSSDVIMEGVVEQAQGHR